MQVRRRMIGKRRTRRVVTAALVVVVLLTAGWVVGFSSAFSVRQVTVDGASIVTVDEVRAAAAIPAGQPLALVRDADVANRITAAIPAVASATVSRRWPSTLVIHVMERAIVYEVLQAGGYGWVSADGVMFNTSADAQPVPTVTVPTSDQALLTDVATVVQAIPASVAPDVTSLAAQTRDSITLQLSGGRQVVWGSADQSELKAQVLVALLDVPGTVYDISSPSNPAVR